MSKKKSKGNILPPLQRRIVLCLASKGQQTINEITKNIPLLKLARVCHYKPTWMAIKWLTDKGVIQKVGTKEYKRRKYPQYWLTGDGALVAMLEGAKPEILVAETKRVYPDNASLACYLELASKLNPETFRVGFLALNRKGLLEPVDLATMFFTQSQTPNYKETSDEVLEILKSYPQEYNTLKKNMEKIVEALSKFNEMT